MGALMNYSETLHSLSGSHPLFSTWKSFPVLRFKEFNQVCLSCHVEVCGNLSYLGTWTEASFSFRGVVPSIWLILIWMPVLKSWLDRLGIPLGNQPRGWAVPSWFSLESWVSELRIGRSCRPEGSDWWGHADCGPSKELTEEDGLRERRMKQTGRKRRTWESMWLGRGKERMCVS